MAYYKLKLGNSEFEHGTATHDKRGIVKGAFSNHGIATVNGEYKDFTSAQIVNERTSVEGKFYGVEVDAEGKMYVNVPWENTVGEDVDLSEYPKTAEVISLIGSSNAASATYATHLGDSTNSYTYASLTSILEENERTTAAAYSDLDNRLNSLVIPDPVSVSNKGATLTPGGTTTIATINGTDITVGMPNVSSGDGEMSADGVLSNVIADEGGNGEVIFDRTILGPISADLSHNHDALSTGSDMFVITDENANVAVMVDNDGTAYASELVVTNDYDDYSTNNTFSKPGVTVKSEGGIELVHSTTPYIDFHPNYGEANSDASNYHDYTVRLSANNTASENTFNLCNVDTFLSQEKTTNIGSSSNRWGSIYGTKGNFSGSVTAKGGFTGNLTGSSSGAFSWYVSTIGSGINWNIIDSNITSGFSFNSHAALKASNNKPSSEFLSMNGAGSFMQFGSTNWRVQLCGGGRGYNYINTAGKPSPEGLYFRKYGEDVKDTYGWGEWRELVSADVNGILHITHLDSDVYYDNSPVNKFLTIPYNTTFTNGIVGDLIGNASSATTAGSCTGNAATATSATNDGNGKNIADTYLPLTAGSNKALTNTLCCRGILPTANATYHLAADGTRFKSGYFSDKVYATNGFYESSDERLKDIKCNLKVDLDKLSELRKVYFAWKEDETKNLNIGVIAQDVKEIYPEIVTETENGTLQVSYEKLSVIALSAVDELYKKNQELEARLAKIEAALNL